MVLRILPAPSGSTGLLAAEIARAVRNRSLPRELLDIIRPGLLTATTPHPVNVLELERLEVSFTPSAATRGGWRFLLEVALTPVAEAEIQETTEGPRFAGIWSGPLAAAAVRAIEFVEPQLAEAGDFLVAALDIPALTANLLWLQSTAGPAQDRFVSLQNCPPELEPGRLYTGPELAELLVPLAHTLADELRRNPLIEG